MNKDEIGAHVRVAEMLLPDLGPVSRHAGDPNNDIRSCTAGSFWATWDHPNGRSVTISLVAGDAQAAGWTRGEPDGPRLGWSAPGHHHAAWLVDGGIDIAVD